MREPSPIRTRVPKKQDAVPVTSGVEAVPPETPSASFKAESDILGWLDYLSRFAAMHARSGDPDVRSALPWGALANALRGLHDTVLDKDPDAARSFELCAKRFWRDGRLGRDGQRRPMRLRGATHAPIQTPQEVAVVLRAMIGGRLPGRETRFTVAQYLAMELSRAFHGSLNPAVKVDDETAAAAIYSAMPWGGRARDKSGQHRNDPFTEDPKATVIAAFAAVGYSGARQLFAAEKMRKSRRRKARGR